MALFIWLLRRSSGFSIASLAITICASASVGAAEGVAFRGPGDEKVQTVLFSADGKTLFVGLNLSFDVSLMKFDVSQPDQEPVVLAKKMISAHHLFLDPKGGRLICGDNGGQMKEWDLTTGAVDPDREWKVVDDKGLVPALALTADGKYLVASHPQDVLVVASDTREVIRTLKGHTDDVEAVGVSSDGKYIASIADHESVRVWEFGGKQLGEFRTAHPVMAYSPTENLIAFQGVVSEAEFDIQLVEVPSLKHRGKLKVGYFQLASIVFSPDGTMLAAGSEKGAVKVWNAATGELLASFDDDAADSKDKTVWARALAFSPDSSSLAVGGYHSLTYVYPTAAFRPAGRVAAGGAKPGQPTPSNTAGDLSNQNYRIWRSADGKFSIKAKLIAFDETTASLETEDGRVIKVPQDKLGFRERKLLKELRE